MKKGKIMKMNANQYSILTNEIKKIEDDYSVKTFEEHRRAVKFAKDQFISFCWSIFHKINRTDRAIITKGLNDQHIETALKIALNKYK